ncbi:MAG: tRNA preQ1(34) S-adenosylmethionine ribosyltransferase-isomerase QueA [Chromatiales bacterium]
MRVSEFNYDLPKHLIAQYPAPLRSESRLLVLDGVTGEIEDRRFADLPSLLHPGDLLVFNDTRVIKARLYGHKSTDGKVELLIERVQGRTCALAHLKPARTQRPGTRIVLEDGTSVAVIERRPDDLFVVEFESGVNVYDVMERSGHVPLPPYIARADEVTDIDRYQTIYSRVPGAIAAPTAGLHFDRELLDAIERRGAERAFVTLHVGAATFLPVRVKDIEQHRMHSEYVEVSERTCAQVRAAKARGNRVVAVGTTSVRGLESAAACGELKPMASDTDIFIAPGFHFRVVDAMITNFHLPRSTLLMLVCAFGGRDRVLAAYRHAVRRRYRFYSYGDAMLVTPQGPAGHAL